MTDQEILREMRALNEIPPWDWNLRAYICRFCHRHFRLVYEYTSHFCVKKELLALELEKRFYAHR